MLITVTSSKEFPGELMDVGPDAFLNQTADATCAMVLRTSLFGFLEFV